MRKQPKWKTRIQEASRAEQVADLDQQARARKAARDAARMALKAIPALVT